MSDTWAKALTAGKSARLLLVAGDADGAVNRAYYAMFDAARAALLVIDPELARAKTHATIIRRFGRHVVLGLGLDASLGRALNIAENLRHAADYRSKAIAMAEAEACVADMEHFLTVIEPIVTKSSP